MDKTKIGNHEIGNRKVGNHESVVEIWLVGAI
jgi:hypothetical protein